MKCTLIILLLSIGLLCVRAEEVTEITSETTQPTIASEKDGNLLDSGKNYDEEPNELEARLPSDYQSIRSNVIDTKFSCLDHEPGYYADIENECQIFHRCLEGQERVFSFICPDQTVFSQMVLVCIWNETRGFNCDDSEDYYEESNRAFSGNLTAESNINENVNNSTEITGMEIDDVDQTESDDVRQNVMSEDIKLLEIPLNQELEVVDDLSEMVEKNSIEEKLETSNVEPETEEFHEFQAELIPSSIHGIDASIAASSSLDASSSSRPQKISISILDPIIEMPSKDEDQLQMSESSRNFRKRSGNHRSRFLFKADAH